MNQAKISKRLEPSASAEVTFPSENLAEDGRSAQPLGVRGRMEENPR